MPTPTITPRKDAKDGTKKFACEYGANDGQVTIWYKEGTDPEKSGFGKIVEALRLARKLVENAVNLLVKEPDSASVKAVLAYHFGGKKVKANPKDEVKEGEVQKVHLLKIIDNFKLIQDGLSGQVILCVSKKLGESERGNTTKEMHLNLNEFKDDIDTAIARTIIHEASHKFAKTHGTAIFGPKEVYAIDSGYSDQEPRHAKDCADSYAWAAISLLDKHVLTPDNFFNGVGCSKCLFE